MSKSQNFVTVLNKMDKEFLKNHMIEREYLKGDILFSPCDKCKNLSIVLKGQIKLCKYTPHGKEQILSFINANEVFGEALVFQEAYYPVFVVAETNCVVGMLSRQSILEATLRSQEFTALFFEELSKKIMLLNEKVELLSFSNIKQRLAYFLLKLAKEKGSNVITIPFTKQKIANLIGTSREVVSRNFSEMEAEQYIQIVDGKKIILNINSIHALLEA